MNSKTLIAAIVALVIFFFGGWLLWGIALEGYYSSNMIEYEGLDREPPLFWAYIISSAAWAILLVFVLQGTGVKSIGKGFSTGFILGLLIAIGMDFSMYAGANIFGGMGVIIVDLLVNGVYIGIVGAITGWILGMGSAATAEPAAV